MATSLGKSQEHGEELVKWSIWILNLLNPCSGLHLLSGHLKSTKCCNHLNTSVIPAPVKLQDVQKFYKRAFNPIHFSFDWHVVYVKNTAGVYGVLDNKIF